MPPLEGCTALFLSDKSFTFFGTCLFYVFVLHIGGEDKMEKNRNMFYNELLGLTASGTGC